MTRPAPFALRGDSTAATATPSNKVWALVLMYGNEEITGTCIESLLAQDHRPLTVLLIDNGSHDGGGARLRERFPMIHYLDTGANLGFSGGMNRGIEYAMSHGAADLLVLNNDTTLDPDCVSGLVAARNAETSVGLVAPKILYFHEPNRLWYAGGDLSRVKALGTHRRFGQVDTPSHSHDVQRVTFASGCAFLMPAEVAGHLGGFAEDFFMYCEDVELSLRLQEAGYQLYYAPAARVYHRDRPTPHPTAFEIRLRDRNRRRIARRRYSFGRRLAFAAWFYPTRLARFGQYLLRGDWRRAGAIIAGAVER